MTDQNELIDYFKYQCEKGFVKRGLDKKPNVQVYRDRLEYETKVILDMKFPGYFLIIYDIVNYCFKNDIPVGLSRGSAASSIVCYCMYITHLDPIEWDLPFSRFLNVSRISMPDIDQDVSAAHREQVIKYIENKYGSDNVVGIGTFGVMRAKNAVRNTARALGHPYEVGDYLSNLLLPPVSGKPQPLQTSIENVPELKEHYEKDGAYGNVIRWAEKFEGLINNVGAHAAGLVVSDTSLRNQIPSLMGEKGWIISQWEMNTLEKLGYVKFDILGLNTLTKIHQCLQFISARHNKKIDIYNLDWEDQNVFKMFQAGYLSGIFQFETSQGFKDLTIQVSPTRLKDLSALVALYRPGPLCISANSPILIGFKNRNSGKQNFLHSTIKELYDSYQNKKGTRYKSIQREVVSLDLNTLDLVKSRIKAVHYGGIKKVYKLNIQTGLENTQKNYKPKYNKHTHRKTYYLKATADHHFLTLDGWKKLKNIIPGEYLYITHNAAFGSSRVASSSVYGRKNFRNIAFRHYEYKCAFCDWNKGSLDVNHIEGNRDTNNQPENLSILCPNHHRMYTEGKISPQELSKEQEKYKLPYTDHIMCVRFLGVEYVGEEEVYDIELEGPHHNFIAGNFVVHNSDPSLKDYLAWRRGETKPNYLIPELEPILRDTGGMLVYQEQVMRTAMDLCGYTEAESDNLRKILGKKLEDKMLLEEGKFKSGWVKNGYSSQAVDELWERIVHFSKYSFNLSHSASYGTTAYITAWLKTYYPVEWMCSCLNCDRNDADQVIKYIAECKRMGINITPPDINKSNKFFDIDKNNDILFGLAPIKNLGEAPVEAIVKERENGEYKSLIDFCDRVDTSSINKLKVESLIRSGCFDFTGCNRNSLLSGVERYWDYKSKLKSFNSKLETYRRKKEKYQDRLDEIEQGSKKKSLKEPPYPEEPEVPKIPRLPEMPDEELFGYEHTLLGFYISEHPLDKFDISSRGLLTIEQIKQLDDSGEIVFAGAVSAKKEITTKKQKKKMAFVIFEDQTGQLEGVMFSKVYDQYQKYLEPGTPLFIYGFLDITKGDEGSVAKIRVGKIEELAKRVPKLTKKISTSLELNVKLDKIQAIKSLINSSKDEMIEIELSSTLTSGNKVSFPRKFKIDRETLKLIRDL